MTALPIKTPSRLPTTLTMTEPIAASSHTIGRRPLPPRPAAIVPRTVHGVLLGTWPPPEGVVAGQLVLPSAVPSHGNVTIRRTAPRANLRSTHLRRQRNRNLRAEQRPALLTQRPRARRARCSPVFRVLLHLSQVAYLHTASADQSGTPHRDTSQPDTQPNRLPWRDVGCIGQGVAGYHIGPTID